MTSDPRPETPTPSANPPLLPEPVIRSDDRNLETVPTTAEEQMEQFEKDLKNNDWGHQPC